MSKQNIVVAGGGGAGVEIARNLADKVDKSKYSIILINPRDRYFILPAVIRMVVTDDDKLEERALIPLTEFLAGGKAEVRIGKIVAVEDDGKAGTGGTVILQGGERVPYRILVLATGCSLDGPLDFPDSYPDIVEHVRNWRAKFAKAKHVAIVGAGPVSLEYAGEIKDYYPDTKVTIIHSRDLPLKSAPYPEKFRKEILKRWEARGVEFILNERVEGNVDEIATRITTDKGRRIDADLIIYSRGPRPITQFLTNTGGDILDSEGHVKIRETLQVEGHPDVFAAGDIVAFKELKLLNKVIGHAKTIVPNIVSILRGSEPSKVYSGRVEGIGITNGKNGGSAWLDMLWGITFSDTFLNTMHSRDLYVHRLRGYYGLPA